VQKYSIGNDNNYIILALYDTFSTNVAIGWLDCQKYWQNLYFSDKLETEISFVKHVTEHVLLQKQNNTSLLNNHINVKYS